MMRLYPLIRYVPRPLLQVAYGCLEAADRVAVGFHNARRGNEPPLPPMGLRASVGNRRASAFLQAGRNCADALRRAAQTHFGTELAGFERILDFGCGCGRTLRHLALDQIEGCDVNAAAIAWMQQNFGTSRFAANRFDPPLPWFEATFDLVYSVSIFTHLNENSQMAWLREIARVLKPQGCALLTVQSEHALSLFLSDAIYSTASMKSRLVARRAVLETDGYLFEPYEVDTARFFPGVSEYGLAFHSRPYIERAWSEFFEVYGVEVGSVDGLQDVVILKKRRELE